MKIQTLNNVYSIFSDRVQKKQSNPITYNLPKINNLYSDTVSFKAKSYDSDSVAISTNHCAYCGCKVYTEVQLRAIASSMLANNSDRLQGEIKSVLEKLTTAKRSDELTVAKKNENRDEIEFFEKLFEQSKDKDKGYLSGKEIFEQVYGYDSQEAMDVLMKNMRPLTRTVDHVSPQNLDEDGKDVDINLVEACYCCNHDIKQGMPFASFYAMYPSIKANMPETIFEYAYSHILASDSDSLANRMSMKELVRSVSNLFSQRTDTLNRLKNIDFRLSELKTSLLDSIATSQAEISQKQAKITEIQASLEHILNDPEYNAMLQREETVKKYDTIDTSLKNLQSKLNGYSKAANELANAPKKGKKPKNQLTEEEVQEKIDNYKQQISVLAEQIKSLEDEKDSLLLSVKELDAKYPTLIQVNYAKRQCEDIISAYRDLGEEKEHNRSLSSDLSSKQTLVQSLTDELALYPTDNFDLSNFTEEEQAQYEQYSSLLGMLDYIEQHNNGNGIKTRISDYAKPAILSEIAELEKTPIVKASLDVKRRKEIDSILTRTNKEISSLQSQLASSNNKIKQLELRTSAMSLTDAQTRFEKVSADIKRIQEKEAYLKYPQIILTLQTEILLAQNTILELQEQIKKIDGVTTPNT